MVYEILVYLLAQAAIPAFAENNPDFLGLKQQLEHYGFQVKIAMPPIRGNYGMLNTKNKMIWINPAVFELGIARPTLIHEAVHAAQLCRGKHQLQLLELETAPPIFARPYFVHYQSPRREMEAEAYAVQAAPDGLEQVMTLLKQHCASGNTQTKQPK